MGKTELSPKEAKVLALAAAGLSDLEISTAMEVSIHTIRGYWLRIRSKMGGGSRAQLVAKAASTNFDVILAQARDGAAEAVRIARDHQSQALAQSRIVTAEIIGNERIAMDVILDALLTDEQKAKVRELRASSDKAQAEAREEADALLSNQHNTSDHEPRAS